MKASVLLHCSAAALALLAASSPCTAGIEGTGLAYQAAEVEPQERADFLSGSIVDAAGKPIAGAKVDAFQWFPGSEAKTDAGGRFSLRNADPKDAYLSPGEKIEVTFSAPGYTPRYIVAQPLGQLTKPIVLTRGTFLHGVIRDSQGRPAARAKVRAVAGPFRGDGVTIREVPYTTISDASGRYKLFLPGDSYEVFILSPAGVSRTPDVSLAPGKARILNPSLRPGVTFRARVVDSVSGQPVQGLKLSSRSDFKAQSDARGEIRIPNMFAGSFEWSVEAPGVARWWSEQASHAHQRKAIEQERGGWQRNFDDLAFDIEPGMEAVTIVAERGVQVRGRVLDPEGQPVAGATVAPALTGTGNSLTGDTRFSVLTNAKGEYDALLPAGHAREWNLIAHDGGYGEWRRWANGSSAPLKTRAGQVIPNFDLRLTRPVVITGQAIDKDGRAVAHAEVRAVQADKRANRYYDPTVETDAGGRFELRFVSPGRHFVQVEPFWLSAEEAPNPSSKTVEAQAEAVDVGTLTQVVVR